MKTLLKAVLAASTYLTTIITMMMVAWKNTNFF